MSNRHSRLRCNGCGLGLEVDPNSSLELRHAGDHSPACLAADGNVHASEEAITGEVCDFCLAQPVLALLIAPGVVASVIDAASGAGLHEVMSPEWALCAACQQAIEAGDWNSVAERACLRHGEPVVQLAVRSLLRRVEQAFTGEIRVLS